MNWTESFTKQIAIFNILDSISTIVGVGLGFFAELNPFVVWLFSFGATGFIIFFLLKLAFSALWWNIDERKISHGAFVITWIIWFIFACLTVWHVVLWFGMLV